MAWRYMSAVEVVDGEEVWTVREVYGLDSWTADAIAPTADSHAELLQVLGMMSRDIEQDSYLDLGSGEVKSRGRGLRGPGR